jgi:hypothetical protein
MLRSVKHLFNDNWDEALNFVLFAYKEVPCVTTGFSPHELIFTYQVRGPLNVIKDSWLNSKCDKRVNVVKYVTDVNDRMQLVKSVVKENAKREIAKRKLLYDLTARTRTFAKGDLVLVLQPKPGHPMEVSWRGPWIIVDKVNDVNYTIKTDSKRKPLKTLHVNLLKPYVSRDSVGNYCDDVYVLDYVRDPEDDMLSDIMPTTKEMGTGFKIDHVPADNRKSLSNLLTKYEDIFSDRPGRTNLAIHSIKLKPNTRSIRQQPYRANPLKMKLIKKEIDDMLDMGIIRESSSAWSSPILLVDKPDGTVRFCVDYRKVNAVSELDSFPIPRIEDLIEKVAGSKFISKLDISKAYWQCELDPESVPISAFVTPFGLFEYLVMPFGLGGAASCFQRLVQRLLKGMEEFSGAYQDDIVI